MTQLNAPASNVTTSLMKLAIWSDKAPIAEVAQLCGTQFYIYDLSGPFGTQAVSSAIVTLADLNSDLLQQMTTEAIVEKQKNGEDIAVDDPEARRDVSAEVYGEHLREVLFLYCAKHFDNEAQPREDSTNTELSANFAIHVMEASFNRGAGLSVDFRRFLTSVKGVFNGYLAPGYGFHARPKDMLYMREGDPEIELAHGMFKFNGEEYFFFLYFDENERRSVDTSFRHSLQKHINEQLVTIGLKDAVSDLDFFKPQQK